MIHLCYISMFTTVGDTGKPGGMAGQMGVFVGLPIGVRLVGKVQQGSRGWSWAFFVFVALADLMSDDDWQLSSSQCYNG